MPLKKEDLQHTIAYQLATARERLGLSQKEVAERVGCAQSEISKIETGERGVALLRAVQLANLYGTSVMQIIENVANSRGLKQEEARELRSGFFGS